MKKAILAALIVYSAQAYGPAGAGVRFQKASEHCYCLQRAAGEQNLAAVVTQEGILIIDPPAESSTAALVSDALASTASKIAVRWIVFSHPGYVRTSGARYFADRGAVFLASVGFHRLAVSTNNSESNRQELFAGAGQEPNQGKSPSFTWFIFNAQIRLFPSNLEIRISAPSNRVPTEGDAIVYVPAEKVLFTGRLYQAGRYPSIDPASEGAATGWIEQLKQVVNSVPVLKSAIPAAKTLSKAELEKSPAEEILVIPTLGRLSNLQEMKDLLESCLKLRSEVARAVRAGRSCSSFLASSVATPFRIYENLDAFTCRLFDDLSAEIKRQKPSLAK